MAGVDDIPAASAAGDDADPSAADSFVAWLADELTSPINAVLLALIAYLLYKICRQDDFGPGGDLPPPPPPPIKKRDFTLEQLKPFNGTENDDGHVLVAINGKVFDVTKGKRFYGPGGPYSVFAGRDASRGLATFSFEGLTDEYDDLSDLKASEMEQVREWEQQFEEKYEYVGKLLRPGEEPTNYSDEEEEAGEEKSKSE